MQLRMQWTVRHTPSRGIWWSRSVLCKVNLTFCRMQLRRQMTVRCTPLVHASGGQEQYSSGQSDIPPWYRHLAVKSSTTSGQLDILQNAIEKADDSQTYPCWYRHLVVKSSTTSGQLDILKSAIEKAVDSHT